MSKNILVYPLTKRTLPYVLSLSKQYPNVIVTTFQGSGYAGRDLGYVDNRENVGINIVVYNNELLGKIDEVIIFDNNNELIKADAFDIVVNALNRKKNVISVMRFSEEMHKIVSDLAKHMNCSFIYSDYGMGEKLVYNQRKSMYIPIIPVIFVGGLINEANQSEVALNLQVEFKNRDIRASLIGYDKELEVLGNFSYSNIFDSHDKEHEKIRSFNTFIKAVIEYEKADIIIISLNGTLMRFNDIITNDFGVYTYMISQAVLPDYVICCAMHGMYDANSYKQLSNYTKSRFNFDIDAVHLSNTMLDSAQSIEQQKNIYINVNNNFTQGDAEELFSTNKYVCMDMLKPSDVKNVVKCIIDSIS